MYVYVYIYIHMYTYMRIYTRMYVSCLQGTLKVGSLGPRDWVGGTGVGFTVKVLGLKRLGLLWGLYREYVYRGYLGFMS